MESNDSPEMSSAFQSYNHTATPTENHSLSNNALQKKQVRSKVKKLPPAKLSGSIPNSNEKGSRRRKRKNSLQESKPDGESKLSNHVPLSKAKKRKLSGKPRKRSPKKRSPKKNRKSNVHANQSDPKMNGRKVIYELPSISKELAILNDDDNLSDGELNRKNLPLYRKINYTTILNITPETGSIEEGERLFGAIIRPIKVTTFFEKYWQKRPYRISRSCPEYYKDLLSTEKIDEMLLENHLEYTKNLDITQYKNGLRETLNPTGRALPPHVWQSFSEGCSIRILNPQTFSSTIHTMNATLQEYFQCMTGANVYLTPPNSQGFAPHYDDIEAFVLQIEGTKRWRLYPPRNRSEKWPRESSRNFSPDEIGQPSLDVLLEAGDLLYFPRGYIHQANTEKEHSLHVTLSVYQKQTYGDLLEILIPMALTEAISENISLRRNLPINVWQCMGLVNSDNVFPERDAMINAIKKCFDIASRHIKSDFNLDNAVDQMALRYQHDALPPKLTKEEKLCTVYNTRAVITKNGDLTYPRIEMDTKIRLVRANILRMVREGEEIRIYYSSENSKEYQEYETNFLEIRAEDAPAVEVLIKAYPTFLTPDQLQLEENEKSCLIAQDLWEKGILMTAEPLV